MAKNRYVFDTTLEGFINCGEPSGQYNNCCFAFQLPEGVLEQAESDREELLEWAKSKTGSNRVNDPKWDDNGLVKFSFEGETGRQRPVFVDTAGEPIPLEVQASIRKGTKVRLICQQTPYTKPKAGTTIKVLGVQVIELVAGNGAVDSGDLSVDDITQIFGKTKGYNQAEPMVREESSSDSNAYDF